jgi:methylphosphotriester-DNA--protein-cysteine methyltransferase
VSYTLVGPDGRPYASEVKGQWGGHRRTRVYGRLDCPSALRAIAAGGYRRHRVFFADEATAVAAGYRPCAACCPDRYRAWKAAGWRAPGIVAAVRRVMVTDQSQPDPFGIQWIDGRRWGR